MTNRKGNNGNSDRLFFWGGALQITADGDWSQEIKRHLLLGRKGMTNLDSILKSRDISVKVSSSQSYGFSSSHVWMWQLDYKESLAPKDWCFWTVVLEKTLESPLDCKEIKLVNPRRNQSWIFIIKTDAQAEIPILWPPNSKNWFIGEDRDARKDWRQKEKVRTEDEMVGWHQRLNGQEFEQALGIGDGQGLLAFSSLWGHRVGHDWVTELNWNELLKPGLEVRQAGEKVWRWNTRLDDKRHYHFLRERSWDP